MLKSPDLIDRAMTRLKHIEPDMPTERLAALEAVLREEFGGQVTRPAKHGARARAELHAEIQRLWADKGTPAREIARVLRIHPSTVYRVLNNLR